jgi:hypothetical protein
MLAMTTAAIPNKAGPVTEILFTSTLLRPPGRQARLGSPSRVLRRNQHLDNAKFLPIRQQFRAIELSCSKGVRTDDLFRSQAKRRIAAGWGRNDAPRQP